jgi:hypothetical protein
MEKVLRESKRTSQLIDNLLWLARADSDKEVPKPGPVPLNSLLREACGLDGLMKAFVLGVVVTIVAVAATVCVYFANGERPSETRGNKHRSSRWKMAEQETRDECLFEENDPRRGRIGAVLFVSANRLGTDSDFTNRERRKYFPFSAR